MTMVSDLGRSSIFCTCAHVHYCERQRAGSSKWRVCSARSPPLAHLSSHRLQLYSPLLLHQVLAILFSLGPARSTAAPPTQSLTNQWVACQVVEIGRGVRVSPLSNADVSALSSVVVAAVSRTLAHEQSQRRGSGNERNVLTQQPLQQPPQPSPRPRCVLVRKSTSLEA